jgi:hypothetical protein
MTEKDRERQRKTEKDRERQRKTEKDRERQRTISYILASDQPLFVRRGSIVLFFLAHHAEDVMHSAPMFSVAGRRYAECRYADCRYTECCGA